MSNIEQTTSGNSEKPVEVTTAQRVEVGRLKELMGGIIASIVATAKPSADPAA